jgi:hypothetical protein
MHTFLLDARRGIMCTRDLVHLSLRSRPQPLGDSLSTSWTTPLRSLSISADTTNDNPKRSLKPRASNLLAFQRNFFDPDAYHQTKNKLQKNRIADTIPPLRSGVRIPQRSRQHPQHLFPMDLKTQRCRSLGDHLRAQNDTTVPSSTWVQVEGISPISTLDAMLAGIQKALNVEEARGLINLDAQWSVGELIPCLPPQQNESGDKNNMWVRRAKLILSPFGRPTGWYLKFDNRSVVYALLMHAQQTPVLCTWKTVKVQECRNTGASGEPVSHGNFVLNEHVSDHTLRVENCPASISETSLLNFFSRFDLQYSGAVQRWEGVTSDGKKAPPTTFLVHFADASWARAALRERQSSFMRKFGSRIVPDEKDPRPLRLVQYPRQIL